MSWFAFTLLTLVPLISRTSTNTLAVTEVAAKAPMKLCRLVSPDSVSRMSWLKLPAFASICRVSVSLAIACGSDGDDGPRLHELRRRYGHDHGFVLRLVRNGDARRARHGRGLRHLLRYGDRSDLSDHAHPAG